MSSPLLRLMALALIVSGASGCDDDAPTAAAKSPTALPGDGPAFTPGSGITIVYGPHRGSLGDINFKTVHEGFHFELKSLGAADVVTGSQTGGTGAHSGWHYHPGPAIVLVRRGTLTSYSIDKGECRRTEYPAGTALIEGTDPHLVVNEGSVDIELYTVIFTPAGGAQRIDTPDPGIC